ncbi:MAG: DNA-3-methyladenine glycosylase [Deltaproteobacteria bacterium ADurb.Bin135]|nr:MAG: DNA-3-methyladenine glycosylase [Deltaproteobacteria bacterium ADurb.Bin135]
MRKKPITEKTIREAERHLSKSDPVMKRLIAEHGPCPIADWEYHPFHTLVTSIISQQLSAKAADTIEGRVSEMVSVPFQPEELLSTPVESLRTAGLSRPKARYVHELAQRVVDGRLSFSDIESANDDEVVAALIESPGIGKWTAEMFLIFGLKRLDVLSLGDAGLQRAARILYGKNGDRTDLLENVAGVWRPYRSVGCWYLWQSLG